MRMDMRNQEKEHIVKPYHSSVESFIEDDELDFDEDLEIECAGFKKITENVTAERALGPGGPSHNIHIAWEDDSLAINELGVSEEKSFKLVSKIECDDPRDNYCCTYSEDLAGNENSTAPALRDMQVGLFQNQDFTICKKCLSNRRDEFNDTKGSSVNLNREELNKSKEICICPTDINFNGNNDNGIGGAKSATRPDDVLRKQQQISSETATYDINDLPDEIMLKIFAYFTPTELCRYVAPVCVSWLAYARDSTLWEVITEEEFKDVSSDLLVKVLTSWCSLLRFLDLKGRTDLQINDFEAIFKSCPYIEELSFAFCDQIDDEILKIVSNFCHNLIYVNFEGCHVSDSALMYLFGKPIHGLNLSHCSLISDEGLTFVANNFNNITSINVDGIQWISQTSIEHLIKKQAESLLEIRLDGDDLHDDCIRILSRCQNIRIFSLSFCDALTDDSLEWIKQFKHLKHLQLKKGINFSNNGMLSLLNNLRSLEKPGLTFLSLSECSSLSDSSLRAISESCPNLELLNLSWCWEVTDDGINFILDSCHKIRELHLCGLHELYGIPFRRVPVEMQKLKFLDLRQCNKTSDDLLADLAAEMKTLTILNYYGDVVKPSLNFWNLESKCSPGHFHHASS